MGKPTRLAPRPKPAPPRALIPMLGETTSRIAKTAAATRARLSTSSTGHERLGIKMAATATNRPSTKYLITRLTISEVGSIIFIHYILFRRTLKRVVNL